MSRPKILFYKSYSLIRRSLIVGIVFVLRLLGYFLLTIIYFPLFLIAKILNYLSRHIPVGDEIPAWLGKLRDRISWFPKRVNELTTYYASKRNADFTYKIAAWWVNWKNRKRADNTHEPDDNERLTQNLCDKFKRLFPERPDQLSRSDIIAYLAMVKDFERMFRHYDVIQCYATEPILALMSKKRPYIAFEHGTLRDFTVGDHPLHRLTSLAYRDADHTFITNGDCLAYAKNLGMKNYTPMIHPIDVEQHRQDYSSDAKQIRDELGAEILIYCPVRHDYAIKGTDRAIEALPLIKAQTDKRVVMIMSSWGSQVEESRARINELGCENNVVWRESVCRIKMIKYIQAADVVFDQFVLPVFGSTAPQAIAAGRPVLASYVPEETLWLIPEPAPIISAFTPDQIAERTINCLDPEWFDEYQVRAKKWMDKYHSPDTVLVKHLEVYRNVLKDNKNKYPRATPQRVSLN